MKAGVAAIISRQEDAGEIWRVPALAPPGWLATSPRRAACSHRRRAGGGRGIMACKNNKHRQ